MSYKLLFLLVTSCFSKPNLLYPPSFFLASLIGLTPSCPLSTSVPLSLHLFTLKQHCELHTALAWTVCGWRLHWFSHHLQQGCKHPAGKGSLSHLSSLLLARSSHGTFKSFSPCFILSLRPFFPPKPPLNSTGAPPRHLPYILFCPSVRQLCFKVQ